MKTFLPLKLTLILISFIPFCVKTYAQTARGNALNLAGGNQLVHTADNDKSLKSYTIESWVYWKAGNPNNVQFLCGKGMEQMEIHFGGIGNNGIRFIPTTGVYVDAVDPNDAVMERFEWVHLAVIYDYDNALAKIYVNGEEKASKSIVPEEKHTSDLFKIGARGNNTYFFDGMLDEFRLWNTVRTGKQIRENMHLVIPNGTVGLVQYFQFNDDLGSIAVADNMSSNAGVMSGATLVQSTVSVSAGTSFTQSSPTANTSYDFTGTGLNLNFGTALNGDMVVTRLDGKPAATQAVSVNNAFANYHWIVRYYGSAVPNQNITAKFNVGSGQLSAADVNAPSLLKLQQRSVNIIDYGWVLTNAATSVSLSTNEITFNNISSLQELVLTRDIAPVDKRVRGNAAVFNGSSTSISIPDIDDALSSYTIESWVYWSPNAANDVEFLFGKAISQMEVHFGGIGDNGIRFIPQQGVFVDAPNAMPINQWTHIAVTYDMASSVAKLYVNGVEKASAIISGANANTVNNFMMGMRGDGTYHFTGKIDEVRIWNTARTQTEIREKMRLTLPYGVAAGLAHYYQFNDNGTSGITIDNIGSKNGVFSASLEPSGANVGTGFSYLQTNPEAGIVYPFYFTSLELRFGTKPNGDVVVSCIRDNPAGTLVDGSNATVFDKYYWVVDNYGTTTTNLGITARFFFDDEQFIAGVTAQKMKLNQRNLNTLGTWNATNQASNVFVSSNLVMFVGVSSLAEIVLSKSEAVLPVRLIDFTAKADGNRAKLQWQTASELNNKGFEIYRSGDDRQFVKIGEVFSSLSNLQQSIINYVYVDQRPVNGNNYYKLVQVDNDGAATELGIRLLNYGLPIADIQISPNPTADVMTASFTAGVYSQLEVIDLKGNVLQKTNLTEKQIESTVSLTAYPAKVYVIRLSGKGQSVSKKVVKN